MNSTRGISFRTKFLAVLFTAVLALMLASPTQIQPSHASGPCTKVNSVKVVSGAKFLCKKVGSKLQWVKQGSNAVANSQPSSPAPSTAVKEWTKCPTAGKVSGSGDKALSCVKVSGKLQWVKNTTLDTPVPKRPCRSEGQIGNWQGEVVLCTPYSSGKIWQIPVFDEDLSSLPGNQGTVAQYRLTAPGWCHGNKTPNALESLDNGVWRTVQASFSVVRSSCGEGTGIVEAKADLPLGSTVRMRVFTGGWNWITAPSTLGSVKDVALTHAGTFATPATTRVSYTGLTPDAGYFRFELLSYQWIGDESVFTFTIADNSRSSIFNSATNFTSAKGVTPIVGQPRNGSWLRFNDQFEIRVKQTGLQWDLTRFSFDLTGTASTPYTIRITTDFTWR